MPKVQLEDVNPLETKEWMEALEAVIDEEGVERAHFLLEKLIDKSRRSGAHLPFKATTAYINSIPKEEEPKIPANMDLERKIRSIIRWNAQIMVQRASNKQLELGGHIASFQSSATLYDVAFNHFFKAPNEKDGGDLIFFKDI